jgi:tetratricopeptide (TPR) repeat protein
MLRIAFVFLAFLLPCSVANASLLSWQEVWDRCAGPDDDTGIKACTILIQAGTETTGNLATAYYNRGWHHAAKGDETKAIDDYTRALEIDHDYADALESRGHAYKRLGKMDLAIADFDRVLELKPGDPSVLKARKQCNCGEKMSQGRAL